MKLTKLEREVLTRALKNQTMENREAPHWRPAVKCPLPTPPQEVGQDPVPPALYETDNRDCRALFNPNEFLQEVKKLFGDEIAPSRTNGLSTENFMRAGFLYAAGKVFFSRNETEKVIEAWKMKAPWLEYFVLPELEPYSDLFSAEILGGMTGQGWEYKTRHKMVDPNADPKSIEQYERTVKKLKDKGFVVRIQGQEGVCTWVGVSITKLGAETIKELEAAEVTPAAPEPEPTGPFLKCVNCGGIFHSVTPKFDPDAMPRGEMFSLLPKYKNQGWEIWQPDWAGESLTCPGCSEPIMSPHTKRLHDGAIVEPEIVEP